MEPNFRLTLAQCQTAAWCFGQPCRQAGQRYEDVPIHSPQTVAAQVWLHTFGARWWHLPEANQATEVEMQALVASVFVHVKKVGGRMRQGIARRMRGLHVTGPPLSTQERVRESTAWISCWLALGCRKARTTRSALFASCDPRWLPLCHLACTHKRVMLSVCSPIFYLC